VTRKDVPICSSGDEARRMAVNFAKLKPRALPLRCGNSVDRMKSRRAAGTANLQLMTQTGRRAAWKAIGRQPPHDFSAAPKIVIIRIKFSVHPGSPVSR